MFAAVALLLPGIIALAVWLHAEQDARRAAVEGQAMETARQVVGLSDAEASADKRELAMIANAPAAQENNLERLSRYFPVALQNNPYWRGLVLRERAT